MARVAKSRRDKVAPKSKASVRKVVEKAVTLRAKPEAAKAETAADPKSAASSKKFSQKFIEAIEKRKAQGGWGARKPSPFGRPGARRGRRPKASNTEYTPENSGEESFTAENEFERIEYDTGISYSAKSSGDDAGFSLDRFDDFDEELNFDR